MEPFNVLIVDDEQEFREMTIKRLNKRGLRCFGAENGMEALEQVEKREIDVVLLDVKMPGMDGIMTLREIKRIQPEIEVVMLTGHASVESGIEGMRLGAFDYLMKPIELEPLIEKLLEANEKKVLRRQSMDSIRNDNSGAL
ncbi:MAG: response regulator [Desulfocapsaceae bacterium]|nr:response regulator [Desulfocapsaceae bacterium]